MDFFPKPSAPRIGDYCKSSLDRSIESTSFHTVSIKKINFDMYRVYVDAIDIQLRCVDKPLENHHDF